MGKVQGLCHFNINIDIDKKYQYISELKGSEKKIKELQKYIKPLIVYRDIDINPLNQSEIQSITMDSSYVTKGLENCSKATLLAATIGEELSNYSQKKYEEEKPWEGFIADHLGSYAVEILVDKFYKYLYGMNISKGLYPSKRLSPGYGDWDLKNQEKILFLLETDPYIKMEESCMLNPIKSITTLIGWTFSPMEEYEEKKTKNLLCEGKYSCSHCRTWACKNKGV